MLVIVLGVIVVLLSAVKVSRPREVARVGGMTINVHEDSRPLIPGWVGGVVIVAGVVLVVAAGRRDAGRLD